MRETVEAVSRTVVFDLDGTLLDSDAALVAPFVALGIPAHRIAFGLPLAEECERLGVTVDDYLAHYDIEAAQPFPGVNALIDSLDTWGLCSNKYPASGSAELARLDWHPSAVRFFGHTGETKSLEPVLRDLVLRGRDIVFVGDTDHDRACAAEVGAAFVIAGWNPRARPSEHDLVAAAPADILHLR